MSSSVSSDTVSRTPWGAVGRNRAPSATARPACSSRVTTLVSSDTGTQTFIPLRPCATTPRRARVGHRLYLHGSTGSRPLREAGTTDPGPAVCVTVTHVDALVPARSAFHHSINYRSVVVHGVARQVTDTDERRTALDALVDQVVPGRSHDARPANAREPAATAVIRLDLDEVSAKVRTGGPNDEPEDLGLPYWTGVIPVTHHYGVPVPADDLDPSVPCPAVSPRSENRPRAEGAGARRPCHAPAQHGRRPRKDTHFVDSPCTVTNDPIPA
jgi:nitroimidazol reductase NimA-like FMN-containing flavoprotein (pyridoxamine 5'-phosphate oxidase superfamily)